MKRDMDLARKILLELEAAPPGAPEFHVDGCDAEQVSYHVMLLNEAGLIEAIDASGAESMEWLPTRLTWDGHEFLDAARDDDRWQKAKDLMRDKAGTVVFSVLKEVLVKLTAGAVLGG